MTDLSAGAPVVALHDVSVDRDGHPALRHVTAHITPGRVLALVGPNGSGKSTLLEIAAGLLTPTSGTVTRAPSTRVAYVAQHTPDTARLPLTVADVVMMGRWRTLGHWRLTRAADRARVAHAVDAVGLAAHADHPLASLSGGQRQRAFIAQALAQETDLLLLDEPLAGLDDAARRQVASAFTTVAATGAAVAFVTHDLEEIDRVDDVVRLRGGRIVDADPGADDGAHTIGRHVVSTLL